MDCWHSARRDPSIWKHSKASSASKHQTVAATACSACPSWSPRPPTDGLAVVRRPRRAKTPCSRRLSEFGVSAAISALGSARVSRAGFGVSPKRTLFPLILTTRKISRVCQNRRGGLSKGLTPSMSQEIAVKMLLLMFLL